MSAYGQTFGRQIIDSGDVTILKFKKLSELPVGKIMTDVSKHYLDSWIKKDDHKVYISKVIHTLRNMLTIIKMQVSTRSTSKDLLH